MGKEHLIVFLCFIVAVAIFIYVVYEDSQLEEDFDKSYKEMIERQEYGDKTMKLVNETGLPEQYTCEQIQIMIKSQVFPPYENSYYCKNYLDDEEHFCKGFYDPNTKEGFVNYYLTECLEQKDVIKSKEVEE